MPVSETVVVRQRIMLLDGEATELTNTYFPASVARGTRLAETSKIPGGAVTLLAELGHVANVVREEVCARMADDQERELLSLGPQEPVLTLTRVVLDTKDEPFQVDMTVFPAASQRLKYEMRMH
nr:transcriptional modulator/regulator [Streptomyces tsukubensis NRRL18488]